MIAPAHAGGGGGGGAGGAIVAALPLVLLALALVAYLVAARRQRARGRGWSPWREAGFVVGIALLAVALSPWVDARADHDFRVHVAQHLLVGMLAPIALVLAAPMTLALRTLPRSGRHRVGPVLRSRAVWLLTRPATVVLLDVGALYLLYLTPLYAQTLASTPLHVVVHAHVLAAGYLLTWTIIGPDPAPHRPGTATRVGILVVAAAGHAVLAKLLYARGMPSGTPHGLEELRQGAELMYYGGDVVELLVATALFAAWLRGRARRPAEGGRPAPIGPSRRSGPLRSRPARP